MKFEKIIMAGLLAVGSVFAQDAAAPAAQPQRPQQQQQQPQAQQPGAAQAPQIQRQPREVLANRNQPGAAYGTNASPRLQQRMAEMRMADLTPEQRTKLDAVNDEYRKMSAPLEERLQKTRTELEEAINAEPFSEQAIRAKAQSLAAIEGDLALARALRTSKLRGFLSAEQVKRLSVGSPFFRPNPFPRVYPGPVGGPGGLQPANPATAEPPK